jgi:hypothetical protein
MKFNVQMKGETMEIWGVGKVKKKSEISENFPI